jgi:small subunit ribosomal protein S14
MKKQNTKDFNKRLSVYKQEKKILLLKFIIRSTNLSINLRHKIQNEFFKMPSLNFSKVRVNNRCILTSRSKSVNSSMKLSRITFRKLASEGLLLGIKKSSW